MYDYFLFDTEHNSEYINHRFGCRERLIIAYAKRNTTKVFYFGHTTNITLSYEEVIKDVWGDRVPYEIVLIKDIKDCPNRSFNYNENYKSSYGNLSLVRIGGNIHPPDISLILYLTGLGKTFGTSLNIRDYFFTKKYSDLIPDFYTEIDNPSYNYNRIGNGPESYMCDIGRYTPVLRKRMADIANEHTSEWPVPPSILLTHTYLRHFLRYPRSNIIVRNNTTNRAEVWVPTNRGSVSYHEVREYRGSFYIFRNLFRGYV